MRRLPSEYAILQDIVDQQCVERTSVRILEAGCGSGSMFRFPENVHKVGTDISQKQLDRNTQINEKHKADIQYYSFPPDSFDIIVCWNVLEHLSEPRKALSNFHQWLSPGGIAILGLPNILSVEGLLTKFTPLWFHVWAFRFCFGSKKAGRDDHGPFKTFMRYAISLGSLKRFVRNHHMEVRYASLYSLKRTKLRIRTIQILFQVMAIPISILSLGAISVFRSAMVIVIQKKSPVEDRGQQSTRNHSQ